MKIKCPFCDEESDIKESDPLAWHFVEEHKYSRDGMGGEYADLIFKIQGKIESLQNEIKDNHFEDCDSGHDFETHQNIEFAIEQLKSLLENGR